MDCPRAPAPALLVAVDQFNAGRYFACHETLEELWLGEPGRLRHYYQGILQVAAGLYHLQRENTRGATLLLDKGAGLLRPFAPICLGIDVAALIAETQRVLTALEARGSAQTLTLAEGLLPQIRLLGE